MWHFYALFCASYFLEQCIEMMLNCQVSWELCYLIVVHILPSGLELKKKKHRQGQFTHE